MLLYLNEVTREIAPQDSVGLLRSPAADCLPRRVPHQRFVACWVLRLQTGGVPFAPCVIAVSLREPINSGMARAIPGIWFYVQAEVLMAMHKGWAAG